MSTRVTLHSHGDDRVIVRKTALPTDMANRQAEAEWLTAARGPGVVEILGVTAQPFTIITAHAGGSTLRTLKPDPRTAAPIFASLCQTLAQLHERSMAHAKLTLDHVVVTADSSAILCSPHGELSDPSLDLGAVAEMIDNLVETWNDAKFDRAEVRQWEELARRFAAPDSGFTARRGTRAFMRLGPQPDVKPRLRAGWSRLPSIRAAFVALAGLGLIGVLLVIALGITAGSDRGSQGGTEVIVANNLYRVGDAADVAVAVPNRCAGQPHVVLLSTRGVIWTFEEAADGFEGSPLATVAGATDLVTSTADGCGKVWAVGPAGRALIVGS